MWRSNLSNLSNANTKFDQGNEGEDEEIKRILGIFLGKDFKVSEIGDFAGSGADAKTML